jgi:hypothetical protein
VNGAVIWRLIETRIRIEREQARRRREVVRAQLVAQRQQVPA